MNKPPRINIEVPDQMKRDVRAEAIRTDSTISEVVRRAIDKYLKENK